MARLKAIAAAQRPDGYINTYFSGSPQRLWRYRNLNDEHELYCMGHLIQAGDRAPPLRPARTDLFRARRAGGQPHMRDVRPGRPGRSRTGIPGSSWLLWSWRGRSGSPRFLRQAVFFLDQRGADPPNLSGLHVHQDHAPVRKQRDADGHSVRLTYLAAAMADAAMETGEDEIAGGLDPAVGERLRAAGLRDRRAGVAIPRARRLEPTMNLPNDRAYAETCAAVGGIFWNARLLAATGAARYADWLETSLYNGALVGVSPDGAAYFYANPLAADPQPTPDDQQGAAQQRGATDRGRSPAPALVRHGLLSAQHRAPVVGLCRAMSTGCRPTLCGCTNTCRVEWRRRCATAVRSACGLRRSTPGTAMVDLVRGGRAGQRRWSCDCGFRHGPQGRRWRWTVSLRTWRPGPMRLSAEPGRRGHRFV